MATTEPMIYQEIKAEGDLALFVDCFWMLNNCGEKSMDLIIVPDGRIDVTFFGEGINASLLHGLESCPGQTVLPPHQVIFAISFNLLAAEFLFKPFVPLTPDAVQLLPADFWPQDINFSSLNSFYESSSRMLSGRTVPVNDSRKTKLSELLYKSGGGVSVNELASEVNWSSRQMNRYFQQHLGMPLKTYIDILRFRASFSHLKVGKLFPEQRFTDQSHFIRDVKKFSGVVPKELVRNANDRFIQLSTLPKP